MFVELLVNDHNPYVIMCSETCATKDIIDTELDIRGYNLLRCDSYSRHTGGTLMYIQNCLKHIIHVNKNYNNNTWCLSVNIISNEIKGIYTVLYHSPSTSNAEFIDILKDIIRDCTNLKKTCVITGDFNIDVSKVNTYSKNINQTNSSKRPQTNCKFSNTDH